jgi:hypothetical protein
MSIGPHNNVANAEASREPSDGWSATLHLKPQLPVSNTSATVKPDAAFSKNVLFIGDAPMAALQLQLAKALKD